LQSATLAPARLAQPAIVLPAFVTTPFVSAGLMFLVEPMVAKMVLPRLGGSPAVWSTCLGFFQAVLLLGYAYAHALTRLFSRPMQILVHVALLLPLAALVLPLDLGAGAPPPGEAPALWLLMRLSLVAGLPVFVFSATARCCSAGSPIWIMKPRAAPISCMPPVMPAACWRCSPIRC
jgi:hypothetical protein